MDRRNRKSQKNEEKYGAKLKECQRQLGSYFEKQRQSEQKMGGKKDGWWPRGLEKVPDDQK